MTAEYQLNATIRDDLGRGASRRLRQQEQVPAIVYGANKAPQSITLAHKDVLKALTNEGFYSRILTLDFGKKQQQVILKALQRHPYKPKVIHIDFYRISAKEKISVHVPLHFLNETQAPGVKQGGMLSKLMIDVEVKCLPNDLPEFIDVDLITLELGQSLHLSDLKLPKDVELVATLHQDGDERDAPVVSITLARGGRAEDEEEAEQTTEESAGGEASES